MHDVFSAEHEQGLFERQVGREVLMELRRGEVRETVCRTL